MKKKVVMFFPKLEKYKTFHYFPISLLQICASLIEKGVECKIIDERVNQNYEEELLSEMEDAICFATTSLTGFAVTRALKVSKLIKNHFEDIPIIWGGPHATALPKQTLESKYVDIVCIGYSDYIFTELIISLLSRNNIRNINGIGIKNKSGEIIINQPLYNEKFNTEKMPQMPYWLIDVPKYINPETKRFMYVSSYGCPGICTFCATKNQRRWIPLDLKKVKKDIEYLLSNYGFKEIVFFDATMFTLRDRLLEIADFLKKYDIKWIADGRAIELYKWELEDIEKLVQSGLEQATIGLETGSERIVNIMKKGTKHLEKFEIATRKLTQFNIKQVSGLILGTPGETISDLKETIAYVRKIRDINPNFRISSTFFRPLPGTELYNVLIEQGFKMPKTLEEWAEEGDKTHYRYNEWMDIPWIDSRTKTEYKRIYNEFMEENVDITI